MSEENGKAIKWSAIDASIVLLFALFACLYQINRAAGNSLFLFLSSDPDNSASFAAALDHPQLFEGDEILSDNTNFSFYSTVHIPVIRFLARFTGDYGSPLILLVGLHVFMQICGFYLFGRLLFQSRYWGALLAILTTVYVPLAIGEFWGMFYDVLSRSTYQAVLPYLLLFVFKWRDRPAVWPWLLGLAGLMMYLHPVSAPCWGFSIWLSLWLFLPESWNIFKKTIFMFFCGIMFLLGALPFFMAYSGTHIKVSPQDYDLIYKIIRYRYARGLFDVQYGITSFFKNIAFTRIFLFGLLSGVYIYMFCRKERKKILLFAFWVVGILVISVVIPFFEQAIAHKNRSIPELFNFPRDFRYLFPVMLIFCLWLFVSISRNASSERKRKAAVIAGFLFVLLWSSRQFYKEMRFLYNKNCLIVSPDKSNSSNMIDMLNAVKRLTPIKSKIMVLASMRDLAVRYYALRPLVYSGKDGGILNYISCEKLIGWYEKTKAIDTLVEEIQGKDDLRKINMMLEVSRKLEAKFLILDRKEFSASFIPLNKDTVYYNDLFALIKVE